ncbi:PREDICTED: SUMO-activating enzyme subunit 2-like [Branchiostoma belcheri]|uniref:SUMO-activating enzyme subunit n=1 Tax=Branchiostoma belcheri TaxID=7741 RepID=A0A6P4ZA72_BRABE|nr:PREDICTED: SUMO-activating enzyme subunit 2-like [Branchiostoma belcheri]
MYGLFATIMAALPSTLVSPTRDSVENSKVLVVGAGGIGCELLKNLVLTNFKYIEVIDLDTIDVSNLNRQFLFQKQHVGKSKAQVAKDSALRFNPDCKIIAYHDSITNPDYGVDFFKKFTLVLNALDNRAARNHVNRMCLAADVPLVESGTAGYLGQVTVIKKGLTECYECEPKPPQKTYPGCTIRNTPSEPIHCIVWAKYLFNQLFGEEDADQDVSPDTEDPELAGEAGERALQKEAGENAIGGGIQRTSTRAWAVSTGYDAAKLFHKLFHDDVKYLLSMEKLWQKRRPPTPLDWNNLPEENGTAEADSNARIQDQQLWSIRRCAAVFRDSIEQLKEQLAARGDGAELVWDKDDEASMDFVTCAANIRAHIFGIQTKTRFDIKSMAGNIIPAIATTNAVIAGLIVMEALKILSGNINKCKTVFLNRQPNPRKKLLVPCKLVPPNPKCYVCSAKPEVSVQLNINTLTVKTLEDKIIKGQFGMVAPDVEIDDGKGTILISSEEGETEANNNKHLSEFGIRSGSRLKADDFLQNYELVINVIHVDQLEEDKEFAVVGQTPEPGPQPNTPQPSTSANGPTEPQPGTSKDVEEEELMIVEVEEEEDKTPPSKATTGVKRKTSDSSDQPAAKKVRQTATEEEEEDDIIAL